MNLNLTLAYLIIAFFVLKVTQFLFLQNFFINCRFLPIKSPVYFFSNIFRRSYRFRYSLYDHDSCISLVEAFLSISSAPFLVLLGWVASGAWLTTRYARLIQLVNILLQSESLVFNECLRILFETITHVLITVTVLLMLANADSIRVLTFHNRIFVHVFSVSYFVFSEFPIEIFDLNFLCFLRLLRLLLQ